LTVLPIADVRTELRRLPGWELSGNAIAKTFTFGSFSAAMAFVLRVAFAAEAADHHPDIVVSYRRVTLAFTTHSAGGLTARDIDGASAVERLLVEPEQS
jgi:4a-hydroxytetrahydrobiopterin dehydratase